jgi:hypothetical protein
VNGIEWGLPPVADEDFRAVSVDPQGMNRFWIEHYASRFIPAGGSKVKWLQGREGSGKSHALHQLALGARDGGMLVVELDARTEWLRGIEEFVRAVLQKLPYQSVLTALSCQVIRTMGYDPNEVGDPASLLDWLVSNRGRMRERALADVREAVDRTISVLDIDLNLKTAIGFGLDRALGAASQDSDDVAVWFRGGKVTRGRLAAVGLSRPLSKLNARGILQGWGAAALAAGLPGLLVTVDNLDQVMAPKREGAPYYTRLRREETYEMLRQFIDDGDALPGVWLVMAARPELFTDERAGFKSYPALDARVVNEIETRALNRFEDHVDWDRVWTQDPDSLTMLVGKWAQHLHTNVVALPPPQGRVSPVRRAVLALSQEVERHDDAP